MCDSWSGVFCQHSFPIKDLLIAPIIRLHLGLYYLGVFFFFFLSPAGRMRRNMPLFTICQNSPINSINLPFMNIPMIINKPWPTDYILSKVVFCFFFK